MMHEKQNRQSVREHLSLTQNVERETHRKRWVLHTRRYMYTMEGTVRTSHNQHIVRAHVAHGALCRLHEHREDRLLETVAQIRG